MVKENCWIAENIKKKDFTVTSRVFVWWKNINTNENGK